MNDSIRRDDLKQSAPTYSAETQRALTRAAKRGAANLTPAMGAEIDRDWLMVAGRQVAIEGLRAFRF